jgi:peptide-methionine (S)-S-oxide reductase
MTAQQARDVATLGGGCFWCTEAVFKELRGVESAVPGYAGGHVEDPTYQEVCGGRTGHAEVVQVTYDPGVITYRDLLDMFFATHDPTTPNRQGADVGPQYRSVIFYHSPEQQAEAVRAIADLNREGIWTDPVVTEVLPLETFYPAEDYHHDYFAKNPSQGYCQAVIAPKVAKVRRQHQERLKR